MCGGMDICHGTSLKKKPDDSCHAFVTVPIQLYLCELLILVFKSLDLSLHFGRLQRRGKCEVLGQFGGTHQGVQLGVNFGDARQLVVELLLLSFTIELKATAPIAQ